MVNQAVNAEHCIAAGQQRRRDVIADETGAAGDRDFHVSGRPRTCPHVIPAFPGRSQDDTIPR
jgi:hypothetical protein